MEEEETAAAGRPRGGAAPLGGVAAPVGLAGRRVGLVQLGCAKNHDDGELMAGRLSSSGAVLVADLGAADTVIVNTCGFIDEARRESIDAILDAVARKGKGVERVLVAGCMASRYAEELQREIPEIDGFVTLDQLAQVSELVALGSRAPAAQASRLLYDHTAPRLLATRGYAYLKVSEGCNNPCTFCAIPVWRGRMRSRTLPSLVEEARALEAQGVRELVLVAQDTTRYGEDLGLGRHGLRLLLERLLDATTIPWLRFLYAYPTTLDDEVLRLLGEEPRCVPYLDIPLQHAHPEILTVMRRGGSAARYLRLLERARALVPDLFVRSTFIVGFPGEQERHFAALLEFVRAAELDHAGAFVYSREEDTPSARLPGRVRRSTAQARQRRLHAAQQRASSHRRRALVGRRLPAMVEGACPESEHLLVGRHWGMAPEVDGRVLINDGWAEAGTLVEIELTEVAGEDLVGRIVGPAGAGGVTVSPGLELLAAASGGAMREPGAARCR